MQRRETIIRRVEFGVPVTEGFGATHVQLNQALKAAADEYWQATGTAPGGPLPDNAIRLTGNETEITVFFELEKHQ